MGATLSVMKEYVYAFDHDTVLDTPEGYFPHRVKIMCKKGEFNVDISYKNYMWVITKVLTKSDANSHIFIVDIIYNIGSRSVITYDNIDRINKILNKELERNNYKFIEFIVFRKLKCRQIVNHQGCEDWTIVEKNV